MATLAELLIKMSVDTAELKAGLDRTVNMAQGAAESIKSALEKVGIGLGLREVIDETQELVEKAGELGAQLTKAAEVTGLSTEALSGLRAEAQTTGEDFTSLTVTMGRLQKNIEAGIISPGSAAGKTLEALLGSAKALKELGLEPADKQIQTVMHSIFELTNEDQRNYAATTLLGKGWQSNVETLKALATEGFGNLEEKASGVGGLYSEEEVAKLKRYGEEWNRLKTTFDNVAISIGGVIAEGAELATTGLKNMAMGVNLGSDMADWQGSYGVIPKGGFPKPPTLNIPTKEPRERRGPTDWLEQMTKASNEFWEKYNAGFEEFKGKIPSIIDPFLEAQRLTTEFARDSARAASEQTAHFFAGDLAGAGLTMNAKPVIDSFGQIANAESLAIAPIDDLNNKMKLFLQIPPLVNTEMSKLDKTVMQFGEHFSSSLEKLIMTGHGFHNLLQSLIADMAELIIKTYVFRTLSGAFGGTTQKGLTGFFGALFTGLAGGKQSGGPVTAGSLYMVGESGPEVFAPGASGTIIPNGALGGGGGDINIDARGAQPGVEHQITRALAAMQKQMAGQSLVSAYEYRARGGTL